MPQIVFIGMDLTLDWVIILETFSTSTIFYIAANISTFVLKQVSLFQRKESVV